MSDGLHYCECPLCHSGYITDCCARLQSARGLNGRLRSVIGLADILGFHRSPSIALEYVKDDRWTTVLNGRLGYVIGLTDILVYNRGTSVRLGCVRPH